MALGIYHILNRGVEKRRIFLCKKDYFRFVHNLKDFNRTDNADQSYAVRRKQAISHTEVAPPYEKLVDVVCWALMPNHPHLMVVEKDIGNASKFSQKIFGGYTMYFNEQNDRSGVLFQGRSKIISVQKEAHFLYLPFYIHLNPLDIFQPGWKESGVEDVNGALKFLEEYKWSNYRDIIGKGNGEFAHITDKNLFFKMFQTDEEKYRRDIEKWLKAGGYREDFTKFE